MDNLSSFYGQYIENASRGIFKLQNQPTKTTKRKDRGDKGKEHLVSYSTTLKLCAIKFGEPQAGNIYRQFFYDKYGNVVKKLYFDKTGKLTRKETHKIDGSGKILESTYVTNSEFSKELY